MPFLPFGRNLVSSWRIAVNATYIGSGPGFVERIFQLESLLPHSGPPFIITATGRKGVEPTHLVGVAGSTLAFRPSCAPGCGFRTLHARFRRLGERKQAACVRIMWD